jgi:hypothetical protein
MPPPPADFTPLNAFVGLTISTSNTETGLVFGCIARKKKPDRKPYHHCGLRNPYKTINQ